MQGTRQGTRGVPSTADLCKPCSEAFIRWLKDGKAPKEPSPVSTNPASRSPLDPITEEAVALVRLDCRRHGLLDVEEARVEKIVEAFEKSSRKDALLVAVKACVSFPLNQRTCTEAELDALGKELVDGLPAMTDAERLAVSREMAERQAEMSLLDR